MQIGAFVFTSLIFIPEERKKELHCKGKVVPVHAIYAYGGGVEVYLHVFLTSALDGVNGQLNAPAALLPG